MATHPPTVFPPLSVANGLDTFFLFCMALVASERSLWASHAPRPIFIGAEKGSEQLDLSRFPQLESTNELLAQVRALQTKKHDFDSVVLESLDWVEPLIWKAVCDEAKVETIEQYADRYGEGCVRALARRRTKPELLAKECKGKQERRCSITYSIITIYLLAGIFAL
jgi:hypothetical protein